MVLQVVVLEDNEWELKMCKETIEQAAQNKNINVHVTGCVSGADVTDERIIDTDIFFLDIETPDRSGIETAKQIRTISEDVPIVFVTNHGQYQMAGYSVHAYHYLLKPLKEGDCVKCLEHAERYARLREDAKLVIAQRGKQIILSYADILFVEAMDHECRIVHNRGEVTCRMTMYELLQKLPQESFMQCHRSYLVNVDYVSKVLGAEMILKKDIKVPVSRLYRDKIQRATIERMESVIENL
ncbi:LytTR family DNA-binding domain-containing protein [Butyricicoccus faecihominis]|uniref:LytR/AlgR family response regulator transcription factor n=1 Tax=Butyricicoccaceae TaxID=3085642 RepID=UPI002478AD60|nr:MULTISPECIES: LytTR family DNA-binding domain-containing protein [Butyricicoccaceae]MCQ5130927.1 LytTR family DNA-binding domain-containing protein [Butyricicoccus faecihominis]WNX85044.1 LytTR family DNA-binding domain-containing protein [Agathobaculum sp. NTUH-O15-33]